MSVITTSPSITPLCLIFGMWQSKNTTGAGLIHFV